MGGDEFVVMLEGVAVTDTAEAAKARIGEALDAVWVKLPPGIPVGASLGHAVYPDDAGDAEGLYAAADARMYAAKGGAQRDASPGDGR
ncbi:MAG: diguanylate cyclase [Halofilum sp. (in: g-proteobacteria)]|nr:diguanylate cyclase [Halofilum sp. (in: g-proteobacteria)]